MSAPRYAASAGSLQLCGTANCRNSLKDLPSEFAELAGIKVLRLKYNQLRGMPKVLAGFKSLEILELADNLISSVDDDVLVGLQKVK